MRFKDRQKVFFEYGGTETAATVVLRWSEHAPGCARCRAVDFTKPVTLSQVCALGAPLAREELAKLAKAVRQVQDATALQDAPQLKQR